MRADVKQSVIEKGCIKLLPDSTTVQFNRNKKKLPLNMEKPVAVHFVPSVPLHSRETVSRCFKINNTIFLQIL